MTSAKNKSRVACVRIPRFPIGAVWLAHESRRPVVPPPGMARGTAPGAPRVPASASAAVASPSPTIPSAESPPTSHLTPPTCSWDEQPLALTEGTLVRIATSAATKLGVRAGMTLAQARAKCAALESLAWDAPAIERETARVSAAFLAASPQVAPERGAPGTWWVGADGFDGIGGERLLAQTLLALARVWHPRARVAIADSCVTAFAATWSARALAEPLHIAPQGDGDYLARVPIALLPMDAELRETLTALGLRTAGAFAALDPLEVERRWGSDGLAAWRLSRGDDPRRPTLARTTDPRAIAHDLATATTTMEPVLFLVRASLDRLVRTLAADGLAAAAVAITLTLDSDPTGAPPDGALPHASSRLITREARPARPMARTAPLFERCRALLDTWTLDAPVRAVEVRISAVAPSSAEQGDLLAPAWRDPAAAEAALARLRTTLGAGSVVRAVRRDSHAPERAGAWEEVEHAEFRGMTADVLAMQGATKRTMDGALDGAASGSLGRDTPAALVPAVRLLESPEPIAITTDKRGTPLVMHWRGRRVMLTRAHGPERLSGEWWHAEPFARDYWRCESDELGQDLLLYRDSFASGWRLQGWYD
jgi:protein ImuB